MVLSAACGCFALLLGCGDAPERTFVEDSVPVSGTLHYQGKPLAQYQVTVLPIDGRRVATGIADAEGNFVLGTNKAGDGAPPGKSKVAIVFAPPAQGEPGDEKIIDNPALLPKPAIEIPKKYTNPETSELEIEIPAKGMKDWKIDLP